MREEVFNEDYNEGIALEVQSELDDYVDEEGLLALEREQQMIDIMEEQALLEQTEEQAVLTCSSCVLLAFVCEKKGLRHSLGYPRPRLGAATWYISYFTTCPSFYGPLDILTIYIFSKTNILYSSHSAVII